MRTILCVDDSTYAADSLKDFLEHHGYNVVACDGHSAVDLVNDRKVEAVLLDCHISHAEEIAVSLRRARRNIPIVMLSAYCGVPCDRMQQADCCLQKGYSPAALLETIEALLRSRRYGLCRTVPYRAA